MLGKLIKYDLKYGMRIFIIIHAILVCSCILGRFVFMDKINFNAEANAIISSMILFTSLFILLFTSVSFGLMALVAIRFYRNLFTEEGYLSWTLPATATQHLWAKIISGYIWHILSILLMAVSLFILVTGDNVTEAYSKVAHEVTDSIGMPLSHLAAYWLIFSILCSIGGIILIYLCIAIGQLFPGHRILCAIVTYFILTAITQVITWILLFALNLAPGTAYQVTLTGTAAAQHTFMLFRLSFGLTIFTSILEYFGVHYIMNKKINLN